MRNFLRIDGHSKQGQCQSDYPPARADFVGRVVNVSDGDTLTVLAERKEVKVWLDSIDAPELKQPFGRHAQQSLAELCAARTARS